MRRDKVFLIAGSVAGVGLAAGTYLSSYNWVFALDALVISIVLARAFTYLFFERFLAFRTFEQFRSEKIRHECQACGACCRLRVNLGADDAEKILGYSKENGIARTVVERRGSKHWLMRDSGICTFLSHQGGMPRCAIYASRPVACRLYPLIPAGQRLKADPLCPGLNKNRGHTFREFLRVQQVGTYVRKFVGKI